MRYEITTITDEGRKGTVTLPVIPAREEPSFNIFTMWGIRHREHEKQRKLHLEKALDLIATGSARRHRGTIAIDMLEWRVELFETSTIAVLATEFDRDGGPEALVGFLNDHFNKADNEVRLRELAAFGRYADGVHFQMLELLLNELRMSHPQFAREDLSELKWGGREKFIAALEFIVRIYKATTFVIWKECEGMDWKNTLTLRNESLELEALRKVPRLDTELLAAVMKNPERMEHYVKKAIGWHPTHVANNAKAAVGRFVMAPVRLISRD